MIAMRMVECSSLLARLRPVDDKERPYRHGTGDAPSVSSGSPATRLRAEHREVREVREVRLTCHVGTPEPLVEREHPVGVDLAFEPALERLPGRRQQLPGVVPLCTVYAPSRPSRTRYGSLVDAISTSHRP